MYAGFGSSRVTVSPPQEESPVSMRYPRTPLKADVRCLTFAFATGMLLLIGGCGLAPNTTDAAAISTTVARHLITEAVPARLGSEVLPYCLGLGSLTHVSAPSDPAGEVITRLRSGGLEVQPVSTCEVPGEAGHVTDRSTGGRRVLLLMSEGERGTPENGLVEAQYYLRGTAAASWRCAVEEQAGEWAVSQCELIWEA